MDKGGSYSECRNTSYRAHRRNCRNSFNLLSSGRHTGCHHSEDHQKDPFRHPDYEMNKEVHIFDFFCCRPAKPFKKSDCRAAVFLYDRKFHFPSYKKTLMRTQRAGNQRLPGNYCLTAIALGASGAHDAYRIRAHTFLYHLSGYSTLSMVCCTMLSIISAVSAPDTYPYTFPLASIMKVVGKALIPYQ